MREVTKVWVELEQGGDGPKSEAAWKEIAALVADGWDVKATANIVNTIGAIEMIAGGSSLTRGYEVILQRS